jgi:hypothetical protein
MQEQEAGREVGEPRAEQETKQTNAKAVVREQQGRVGRYRGIESGIGVRLGG